MRRPLTLAAVGLAASFVACAPKEQAPPPPPPSPNVVTMTATDYAFDGPAQVPSGMTTFKLINNGHTFHHLIIARIDSGKTFDDAKAAFAKPGPPPAWLAIIGGPNAPDPGGESNATLDIKPGEYALFCIVDLPGGVPHVAKGMVKQMSVTAATGPAAAAPAADISITLADYSFTLSQPITAGKHTFAISTPSGQLHELEIFKLDSGKTSDDFMKWMGGKMDTPPPGHGMGGTAPFAIGSTTYVSADFAPGNYVFICFMPDEKDKKPHFLHGMLKSVTVN